MRFERNAVKGKRKMKKSYEHFVGQVFSDITILGYQSNPGERTRFLCVCKCGQSMNPLVFSVTSGVTKSCRKCAYEKTKKVPDSVLIELYNRLGNVWKVADEVKVMGGQSIHERLTNLGVQVKMNYFTDDDLFYLKEHYNDYLLKGDLQKLADKMGRTKEFICRQAKKLGFTDNARPKTIYENFVSPKGIPKWDGKEHPRGMKGKEHSQKTKDRLSITSTAAQAKINEDEDRRAAISKKQIMTKKERGNMVSERQKVTWRGGWREIGGKRKYFRSRWEANYARYLEFLKVNKQIKEWEHEPDVFWFEGIKRGCVSFLPDFRITENSGVNVYHEVKGWMDDRSKTKIRRMALYHPSVSLTIIDATWYKKNNRNLTQIIYGWEV